MSVLQHNQASPGGQEPHINLPQRPEPKGALDTILQMRSLEICRNYKRGRCLWGAKCHRSHDIAGRPDRTQPEGTHQRIVDGVYTDRLGKIHTVAVDSLPIPTSSVETVENVEMLSKDVRPDTQDGNLPSIGAPGNLTSTAPARVVEEDARPARKTNEVCRMHQKGLCKAGELCHRAHIFELPEQASASSSSSAGNNKSNAQRSSSHLIIGKDGLELCKLNLAGKCARGDACSFSHEIDSRSFPLPPSIHSLPPSIHSSEATQSCRESSKLPDVLQSPDKDKLHPSNVGGESILKSQHTRARQPSRFVVLPEDVCLVYYHKGRCIHRHCKFRHCNPGEVCATAEVSNGNAEQSEGPESSSVPDNAEHRLSNSIASHPPSTPVLKLDNAIATNSGETDGEISHDESRPPDTAKKRDKMKTRRKASRKTRRGAGKTVGAEDVTNTDGWEAYVAEGQPNQTGIRETNVKASTVREKGKNKESRMEHKDVREVVRKHSENEHHVAAKDTGILNNETEQDKCPQTTAPSSRSSTGICASGAQGNEPSSSFNSVSRPQRPLTPASPVKENATTQSTSFKSKSSSQDEDTAVEDSDTTCCSAQGSRNVSAASTSSSIGNTKSALHVKPCFHFIYKGLCARTTCRYSHDTEQFTKPSQSADHERHGGSARQEAARVPPSLSSSGLRPAFPAQGGDPSRSDVRSQTMSREAYQDGVDQPIVPPGLGLENPVEDSQQNPLTDSVTITVLDSTRVTFSSGFGISQVTTGFESRQIILSQLPVDVVPAVISAELQLFGEIISVLPADSPKSSSAYRVTFSNPDSAAEAAAALDGVLLFNVQVSARLTAMKSTGIGRGKLVDGDVLFDLPTPAATGYVAYPTREEADKAIALAGKKELRSMRVTGEIYQGVPNVGTINVRMNYMPADSTEKDLARYGPYESYMFARPKYKSISGAIDGLKRMLAQHGTYSINILPPPYRKYFRIWAHFEDPREAEAVSKRLDGFHPAFVGKQKIFAHHVKSLRYNLPSRIFDVLAHDINLLRTYVHDEEGTSITTVDRRSAGDLDAPVLVTLVSRSMSSLTKVKMAFDRLLRGQKVTDNGQIVWNDFFGGHAGMKFLDELERTYPTVKINRDPRRRTIALFGPEVDRELVHADIIARAKLLKARRIHRYPVAGDFIAFVNEGDIMKLRKELGRENIWFDYTKRALVVCGDEDTQQVARLAVINAGKHRRTRPPANGTACPVCLGDVTHPVNLSCGHRWCKACLAGYMNAAVDNKTFPVTCLGDEARCSQAIPLSIAQELLSTNEFDAIVNAAFLAHVQSRPDEYHYCPTPDCPQVYRKTTRKTVLQCPSCLVRICPYCNTEYHETTSCQQRNAEDERLLDDWKHVHDVKDCPNCKVPIERTEGCNHMMCISCQTHICWACLHTFPTSQEVYDHMRSVHGGIGL